MNFYPFLEKAHYAGKNMLLFLICNSSIMLMAIAFLLGWWLWYESFFVVLQEVLTNTHIESTIAGSLIHQVYTIGTSLVIFLVLLTIVWRVSIPFTYARLNLMTTSKAWWHIFVFDFSKIILTALSITSFRYVVSQHQWLLSALVTLFTIALLSFIRFYETIYFSSPHVHSISSIFKSWFSQLRDIVFLHGIDIVVWTISFCMLGLIIASFTYLPFVLAALFLLASVYLLGRILLVWKGLWSYASYALHTNSITQ